jgi:hypothetical protein
LKAAQDAYKASKGSAEYEARRLAGQEASEIVGFKVTGKTDINRAKDRVLNPDKHLVPQGGSTPPAPENQEPPAAQAELPVVDSGARDKLDNLVN